MVKNKYEEQLTPIIKDTKGIINSWNSFAASLFLRNESMVEFVKEMKDKTPIEVARECKAKYDNEYWSIPVCPIMGEALITVVNNLGGSSVG